MGGNLAAVLADFATGGPVDAPGLPRAVLEEDPVCYPALLEVLLPRQGAAPWPLPLHPGGAATGLWVGVKPGQCYDERRTGCATPSGRRLALAHRLLGLPAWLRWFSRPPLAPEPPRAVVHAAVREGMGHVNARWRRRHHATWDAARTLVVHAGLLLTQSLTYP